MFVSVNKDTFDVVTQTHLMVTEAIKQSDTDTEKDQMLVSSKSISVFLACSCCFILTIKEWSLIKKRKKEWQHNPPWYTCIGKSCRVKGEKDVWTAQLMIQRNTMGCHQEGAHTHTHTTNVNTRTYINNRCVMPAFPDRWDQHKLNPERTRER